jgi:hypothetical protein
MVASVRSRILDSFGCNHGLEPYPIDESKPNLNLGLQWYCWMGCRTVRRAEHTAGVDTDVLATAAKVRPRHSRGSDRPVIAAELTADSLPEMLRRAIDRLLPWLANNVLLTAAVGCDMSFVWRACQKGPFSNNERGEQSHENANARVDRHLEDAANPKVHSVREHIQETTSGLTVMQTESAPWEVISADARTNRKFFRLGSCIVSSTIPVPYGSNSVDTSWSCT